MKLFWLMVAATVTLGIASLLGFSGTVPTTVIMLFFLRMLP